VGPSEKVREIGREIGGVPAGDLQLEGGRTGRGLNGLRNQRQLRKEKKKLKRTVMELMLEKHICQEVF
jgi:hypothetical protein